MFVKKYRSLQWFESETGSSAPKGRKGLFILTVEPKCKLHNKSVYPNTDLFHAMSGWGWPCCMSLLLPTKKASPVWAATPNSQDGDVRSPTHPQPEKVWKGTSVTQLHLVSGKEIAPCNLPSTLRWDATGFLSCSAWQPWENPSLHHFSLREAHLEQWCSALVYGPLGITKVFPNWPGLSYEVVMDLGSSACWDICASNGKHHQQKCTVPHPKVL